MIKHFAMRNYLSISFALKKKRRINKLSKHRKSAKYDHINVNTQPLV